MPNPCGAKGWGHMCPEAFSRIDQVLNTYLFETVPCIPFMPIVPPSKKMISARVEKRGLQAATPVMPSPLQE